MHQNRKIASTAAQKRIAILKVAFFQKVIPFSNLPISKKKEIFQKTILDLKFKIPGHNRIMLWAGILNFKFRMVFWNIVLGDWEI